MGVALKYMGLGLALGAAWGGIARSGLAQPTQTDRPSVIRVEADDNDGDEPLVTIGAAPRVLWGVSGDVIELALTLDSSVARRFGVRCSYELIDSRGITVQRPVIAELVSEPAVGTAVAVLVIPAGLADGRFEIRLAVAAADGVQGTLQIAER